MNVRQEVAQCPRSISWHVRRSIRATSDDSSGHLPGNSRAVSEQLPGTSNTMPRIVRAAVGATTRKRPGNCHRSPRSSSLGGHKSPPPSPTKQLAQRLCNVRQKFTKQTCKVREPSASTDSLRTQSGHGHELDTGFPHPWLIQNLVKSDLRPQTVREPEQFTSADHPSSLCVHTFSKSVGAKVPETIHLRG